MKVLTDHGAGTDTTTAARKLVFGILRNAASLDRRCTGTSRQRASCVQTARSCFDGADSDLEANGSRRPEAVSQGACRLADIHYPHAVC